VPGHWEGDLLFGTRSSAVATLVERKSRFVMLVHLPSGRTAGVVADALADVITGLPGQLRRSITWDQGKEMAEHARFSVATGVPVPGSPGALLHRGPQRTGHARFRAHGPGKPEWRFRCSALARCHRPAAARAAAVGGRWRVRDGSGHRSRRLAGRGRPGSPP
jgi:integrase-like protein